MTVVSRSEWGARAPRNVVKGNLSGESTCHWNGPTLTIGGQTTWDHSKCAALVRGTQNFHMDSRGWSDIAYNFVICPHGVIFEGRGLNVVNAANGTDVGNHTSHTVMCLAGDGNPFGDDEKRGIKEAVGYIASNTSAPDTCKGHRDWHSTECPGDARYAWVHAGMQVDGSAPQPPPVANPPVNPGSPNPFAGLPGAPKPSIQKGSTGAYVTYLQKVISLKAGGDISVDGQFGDQTERRVKDVQRIFGEPANLIDGKVGPRTWGFIDFIAVH